MRTDMADGARASGGEYATGGLATRRAAPQKVARLSTQRCSHLAQGVELDVRLPALHLVEDGPADPGGHAEVDLRHAARLTESAHVGSQDMSEILIHAAESDVAGT